jgi:hypothetical protein
MIGATDSRKVRAVAFQAPSTARRQGRTVANASPATTPTTAAITRRRRAGACQPSQRWYTVGAGTLIAPKV